jgi:hyperosmotically inducible protein
MKKGAKLGMALVLTGLALTPSILSAPAGGAEAKRDRRDDASPRQPGAYLARAVRHQLLMLPYYSVFDNLEFRVDGYKVTLMGEVVRPTLKSDAENVVKRIEGVERVVNKIKVLPTSFLDDRIRRATYRAIYRHPVLQRYALQPVPPIHIIVDHGHVTLVGVVGNEMDKNVAYLQANSVPDVFSVANKLRVEKD